MAVVELIVARKRGVEAFITYDDAAIDAQGGFDVLSWGIRGISGSTPREVQVTLRLKDGSVLTSARLLSDRTRSSPIAVNRRPRGLFRAALGGRIFTPPRLDGLEMSITTFGD